MKTDFSYSFYKKIIKAFLKKGCLYNFHQVLQKKPEKYIIIRHDIEFSPKKALLLAKLEKKLGIKTTYLVQVRSHIYNAFSSENLAYLKAIKKIGHRLGLHYYFRRGRRYRHKELILDIKNDLNLLAQALDSKVDIFSFHRPTEAVLKKYLAVPGVINCYDRPFFHFSSQKKKLTELPAIYLSDSNNLWRYGKPLKVLKQVPKIKMQILLHPYSWNKENLDDQTNLKRLFKEKTLNLDKQFSYELKNYSSSS